jgi:hypothetical protein
MILEDDIDMEWDIRERLGTVWSLLPARWDIMFLHPRLRPLTRRSPPHPVPPPLRTLYVLAGGRPGADVAEAQRAADELFSGA